MKLNRRSLFGAAVSGASCLAMPKAFAAAASGARPHGLDRAIAALDAHKGAGLKRDFLGLVDFNRHSREQRFHMVDIGNGRVLASHLVAHGKGSDPMHTGWVQKLSNRNGSNSSSGGSFKTAAAYYGKHGRSRRLYGLDTTNDQAFARAIVIHGADYVSPNLIVRQGKIGRSLGCFAVEQHVRDQVLDLLGEDRLLFALM